MSGDRGMPISVSREKCIRCGLCEPVCLYDSIVLVEGCPEISDSCTLCGACVEACPRDAIIIAEIRRGADLSEYSGVLIFAEQRRGRIHPVTYELLGKGRKLAEQLGEPLYAVVIGSGIRKRAEELVARGADRVFVYDDPFLEDVRDDPYSTLLFELVREEKPSVFLIGATATGRSLGPKVAACLGTGLTADCTGLEIDPDSRLLVQTRPAFGGNIMATIICPDHRPQIATVRYKVMTEALADPSRQGEIVEKTVDVERLPDRVKVIDFKPAVEEVSIVDADIVVSGGKGLGDPKGFELIEELAHTLGGAVGASRPTVDEGWITYRHQVGLSGRTVRPKLYLACGISGSVQHQAGMRTSDIIIAINKDREAPIFGISSLGAVGDLYEVVPLLIEKINEHVKNSSLREGVDRGQAKA